MSKSKKFDQGKEVRTIARERIGRVKATKVIVPKKVRRPKYDLDGTYFHEDY